jgi:hypothetical protein
MPSTARPDHRDWQIGKSRQEGAQSRNGYDGTMCGAISCCHVKLGSSVSRCRERQRPNRKQGRICAASLGHGGKQLPPSSNLVNTRGSPAEIFCCRTCNMNESCGFSFLRSDASRTKQHRSDLAAAFSCVDGLGRHDANRSSLAPAATREPAFWLLGRELWHAATVKDA